MKIYMERQPMEVLDAVRELQKLLYFEVVQTAKESDLQVLIECVELSEHDIQVRKEGRKAVICYSRLSCFSRSLFLLLTGGEGDFCVCQKAAFGELGILLDCSRNAVLKVETLRNMIRHFAAMGYHTLQLYTEDTYQVEVEAYFGYMRGAFTKMELQEIDEYCGVFGIELVPCIQCLAHINQITRYEQYNKMIDTDDILLVGEERTYVFLEHVFAVLSETFTSRKVNIGMDEAHMLGRGRYLDQNGYKERFDLMVAHLGQVRRLCKKYGFEPQMWSDMFFRLVYGGEYYVEKEEIPMEVFDKIPKDIRLIYWDYYSTDGKRYDSMIKKHKEISKSSDYKNPHFFL